MPRALIPPGSDSWYIEFRTDRTSTQPGQQGGAGHGTNPDSAQQQPVAARAQVQRRLGDQRQ